jgi:predicted RNA-binding Zn-ribbon protein involved in translation (DUF1610 family)
MAEMIGSVLGAGPEAGLDAVLGTAFRTGKAPAIGSPDPYKDKKRLLELAQKCKKACIDQERWSYERVWWRNILYQLGRQWIYFDGSRNQWRDKRLQPWMPRPVTNKIAETTDSIMSVFQSVQLGANAMPISPSPSDESTAQTLNRLQPAIHAEHTMDAVVYEHDWWLLVTGNAFLHPWWDSSRESGFIVVDFEQCTACGLIAHPKDIKAAGDVCPQCGSPILKTAMGQDGKPIQEKVAFGKGCTDVLSPLEIATPNSYGHLEEMPYIIRKRWRAKTWYERYAPELAKTLNWETQPTDRSLQLLRGISTGVDIGPSPGAMGWGNTPGPEEDGKTEYELWYRPDPDWPEGAVVRFTDDGQLIELPSENLPGPLPNVLPDGTRLMPFLHTRYEIVGGRFWGRSILDRLITKQDQINQIDALIQLIIQRCANPVWMKPKGSEVRRLTGEPGLVFDYSVVGNNAKPERISGEDVPSSLFRIREGFYQDFESLAGTYDVIKGQKPSGVEAFSALQLLVERSQSRYGPVLAARGRTYRDWYSMAIELERQYGPDERVWTALGPNQTWTFEKFKHAELQGAVRILVEDGSQTPKTSLGKRAAIQQLQTLGVIDPRNPETGFEILKTFGETSLLPSLDTDIQAVLRVQDEFERWAATVEMIPGGMVADPVTGAVVPGPPMPDSPAPGARKPWQNAVVFSVELKKWANSDKVNDLLREKPWLETSVAWLIMQHEMALMPPPMPGDPGGGAPGAGQAMANSNGESGNPNDVPKGTGEGPQNQGPQ